MLVQIIIFIIIIVGSGTFIIFLSENPDFLEDEKEEY